MTFFMNPVSQEIGKSKCIKNDIIFEAALSHANRFVFESQLLFFSMNNFQFFQNLFDNYVHLSVNKKFDVTFEFVGYATYLPLDFL